MACRRCLFRRHLFRSRAARLSPRSSAHPPLRNLTPLFMYSVSPPLVSSRINFYICCFVLLSPRVNHESNLTMNCFYILVLTSKVKETPDRVGKALQIHINAKLTGGRVSSKSCSLEYLAWNNATIASFNYTNATRFHWTWGFESQVLWWCDFWCLVSKYANGEWQLHSFRVSLASFSISVALSTIWDRM
jgi:hypothetical protein